MRRCNWILKWRANSCDRYKKTIGTCTLVASQSGYGDYAPAQSVSRSFVIAATASAPDAPTFTSATGGTGTLELGFIPSSDGGAAISNYEYALDGSTWVTLSPAVTTSPISLTGIPAGTYTQIKIRAVNSVNSGTASSTQSATVTATSSGTSGTNTPTPTTTPIATPKTTPTRRPNNLLTNPLSNLPTPTPSTQSFTPGTSTTPSQLLKVPISNLIEPLKPVIVDLFNSPSPNTSAAAGAATFTNESALNLLPNTQDKKVVDLPSLVLIDNKFQESKIVIVENTIAQIVTSSGGLLNVEAKDGNDSVPVNNRGRVQMVRNNDVQTDGSGLAPNSEFAVYLFSDPILLGVGKTNAQGEFFASFPVEKELPIGDHTLQVNGQLPDGKTSSISMPVTVVDTITTAQNQAMPQTIFVKDNPIQNVLQTMYWMLVVLAVMIIFLAGAFRERFFILLKRRKTNK